MLRAPESRPDEPTSGPQPSHILGEGAVQYFDHLASTYTSLYESRTPGGLAFRLRRQRVLELFDQAGGRVLDVGCGSGVMADDFLARGCEYYGIDPSPRMIGECRRAFAPESHAHFAVGGAEVLSFPDGSFDAVLCVGVLERVHDDRQALREMVRVLRPGGTLIVTVPSKFSPYVLWRDFLFYPLTSLARPAYYRLRGRNVPPVIPPHRLYGPATFARTITRLGCTVTATAYCGFQLLVPPLDTLLPRVAMGVLERAEGLRHGPLRKLGFAIITRAAKG